MHKKLNAATINRFSKGKAKGIREKSRFLLCRNTGSKIVYFAQILCLLNFFVPWGSTGEKRGEKGKLNMILFTLDKKTRKTLVFRAKT